MDFHNKTAVVAGAGVMGASIAQVYAKAGFRVIIYDIEEQFLKKGERLVALNQETMIASGLLTKEESCELTGRITYSVDDGCFAVADIIEESIVEKLDVKHVFWRKVSGLAKPDALLATNTSGLHISDIATAVTDASRFAGQHWVNPPHLIPMCEIIKGKLTSDKTIEAFVELARFLGKKPVVLKNDISGFIFNRLQFALLREALHIVESGSASIEDIDNVMKYGLGMRYACLGPFDTADLGGLDTFDNISSYLFAELSDKKDRSELLHSLVEQGNLGVKSGKGFYDYADGRDEEVIRHRDEMFIKLAKCLYMETE